MRLASTLLALAGLLTVVGNASAQVAVDTTVKRCSSKLQASDGTADDTFGSSVAIHGTIAIVGAPTAGPTGASPGAAYLFHMGTGQEIAKLSANDGVHADFFGCSVGISGSAAVVGAWRNEGNVAESGAAYVFDVVTGRQIAKLVASDGSQKDRFGHSVGISGTRAVVGARSKDDTGVDSGAAYLFDVQTGKQLAKLSPTDGDALDVFGGSVAISGGRAIVGAVGDDDNGSSGSAYVFDVETGQQLLKLLPSDGGNSDSFGSSVAISGTVAIIGASGDDDNGLESGSAYLFDVTTGQQLAKLLPNDGKRDDRFGSTVGISGPVAIVGAPYDDHEGKDRGSAYLFDVATGQQITKLLAKKGQKKDQFGFSVAIDGPTAIVGVRLDDGKVKQDRGSARLFGECPRFGKGYCWTHPNSSGLPARLLARGSPHLLDNDLTLITTNGPPHEVGYYLMSATQDFVLNFGGSEGNLCLGNPLVRFRKDVLSSGAGGEFAFQPDLTNLPDNTTFLPGETWSFQCWFRDGSSSNTSNGLAITWQ